MSVPVERGRIRASNHGERALEGDKARFLLSDSGSPTVIHDGSDENALYVLMPMRV